MIIQWLRLAVVLGCMQPSTLVRADPQPSVDRVVEVLTTPDHPARPFVRAYAAKVAAQLGSLDDFAQVLVGEKQHVCNLICEAKAAPAYFKSQGRQTWVELIRYVFTATCYGASPEFMRDAIDDLDKVLLDLDPYDPTKFYTTGATEEGEVVIHVLERARRLALKNEKPIAGKDQKPNASDPKRYPSIVRLVSVSPTVNNPDTWELTNEGRQNAIKQACKSARYIRSKRG